MMKKSPHNLTGSTCFAAIAFILFCSLFLFTGCPPAALMGKYLPTAILITTGSNAAAIDRKITIEDNSAITFDAAVTADPRGGSVTLTWAIQGFIDVTFSDNSTSATGASVTVKSLKSLGTVTIVVTARNDNGPFAVSFVVEVAAKTYDINVIQPEEFGTFTVSLDDGVLTGGNTAAREGQLITLTAHPESGYKLDFSVTGAVLNSNGTFIMPAGPVTVSAAASPLPLRSIAIASDITGGSISINDGITEAREGDTFTINAAPASGMELVIVTVNGRAYGVSLSGNSAVVTMPSGTGPVTVSAQFLAVSSADIFSWNSASNPMSDIGGGVTVMVPGSNGFYFGARTNNISAVDGALVMGGGIRNLIIGSGSERGTGTPVGSDTSGANHRPGQLNLIDGVFRIIIDYRDIIKGGASSDPIFRISVNNNTGTAGNSVLETPSNLRSYTTVAQVENGRPDQNAVGNVEGTGVPGRLILTFYSSVRFENHASLGTAFICVRNWTNDTLTITGIKLQKVE